VTGLFCAAQMPTVVLVALASMPLYWQEIFAEIDARIDSPYYTSVSGRYAWALDGEPVLSPWDTGDMPPSY